MKMLEGTGTRTMNLRCLGWRSTVAAQEHRGPLNSVAKNPWRLVLVAQGPWALILFVWDDW